MNMKKSIFAVVAVMLVAVLASGCGGGAPAPSEDGTPEAVKIGLNLELSGNVAQYGQSTANGVEMAFNEINEAGGINGAPLEIVLMDNKSDNGEALNAATKLITQDKVAAVVGPVTSGNAIATIPIATQYQVPVVTPTGTNKDITVDPKTGEVHEFMFRTCFIDPFQGQVAAKFAAEDLGAKTAAIYVDNNSDYSKGLQDEFTAAFEAAGGEVVAVEGFVIEDKDFRAALTKIKATDPDMIYVPAFYEQVGAILKQARELGYDKPMMGADGWDSPKLLEVAGAAALQNGYFTNHYSTEDTDPMVQDFVAAYTEQYGSTPDALAALGYDCAYIVADAVSRAGSGDPVAVKDALAATADYKGVTGSVSLDEFHNPVKAAVVLGFTEDGAQTFVAKVNP